jgi:DNA-3-methyladenine glycosylase II
MSQRNDSTVQTVVRVSFAKPYDFALSLSAVRSFIPDQSLKDGQLRLPVMVAGYPVVIEITAGETKTSDLKAISKPESKIDQVRTTVEWVLFAELDLSPFYRLVGGHSKIKPITEKLHGLKPMRPASLFEMAVVAITEQQLSLASAYHIRNRLVQRFGRPVDDLRVFPEPGVLARASPEELRSCGLSKQKADYIQGLAGKIAAGDLDLDRLKRMSDDEARETIMGWRGFGQWSADYILVRGLARPDCVPVDDIGIREVIGKYLDKGRRATSEEVAEALEAFRPYRGLLAFYLLAYKRLNPAAG